MLSLFKPCPLSETDIHTCPPSFLASSTILPFSILPASARSSLLSMPWSTELRIRCIRGSDICSIIFLSTSVSSPITSSSISLPSFLDVSYTIRFIFWNVFLRGIIRIAIIASWSSDVIFDNCAADFWKLDKSSPGTFKSGFCNTVASAITSSPIKSISKSIFLIFTLIKLCASPFFGAGRFAGAFLAGFSSLLLLSSNDISAFFSISSLTACGFWLSISIVGCSIGSVRTSPALDIGASASAQNSRNSSAVHSLISIFSIPALELTSSIILSGPSVVWRAILNPNSSTTLELSGFEIISAGVKSISSAMPLSEFTAIYALIFAISRFFI